MTRCAKCGEQIPDCYFFQQRNISIQPPKLGLDDLDLWAKKARDVTHRTFEAGMAAFFTGIRLHYWKRHRIIFEPLSLDQMILEPAIIIRVIE